MSELAKVTIGVPVYNGGALLRESLGNLAEQTLSSLRIIIHDNASTDNTGEIAREFTERDKRFSYHRHSENIGAIRNFISLLERAETPYFMWRAYDDISDVNFSEELVRLLEAHDHADLAVGNVTTVREGRRPKVKTTKAPPAVSSGRLGALHLLRMAHPSWFYGLWRTEVLRSRMASVFSSYPHAWAGDHILLFESLYKAAVAGSAATTFYQRLVFHEHKAQIGVLADRYANLSMLRQAARSYLIDKSGLAPSAWPDGVLFRYLVWWFIENRVYRRRKLRKIYIRMLLGEGVDALLKVSGGGFVTEGFCKATHRPINPAVAEE